MTGESAQVHWPRLVPRMPFGDAYKDHQMDICPGTKEPREDPERPGYRRRTGPKATPKPG